MCHGCGKEVDGTGDLQDLVTKGLLTMTRAKHLTYLHLCQSNDVQPPNHFGGWELLKNPSPTITTSYLESYSASEDGRLPLVLNSVISDMTVRKLLRHHLEGGHG